MTYTLTFMNHILNDPSVDYMTGSKPYSPLITHIRLE